MKKGAIRFPFLYTRIKFLKGMDILLKSLKLIFLLAALLVQGCSSIGNQSDSHIMSYIILPEPLPLNLKNEIILSRLNDIILRADIADVQRAELYYERGLKYDSLGLRYMARIDFNHALRLKPDFADAYNFLGIHYTQVQEYQYAYDAFDAATELASDHEYAYFNRGIALYYGARSNLALTDLNYFYSLKEDDVFRILWLYFAEHTLDSKSAYEKLKQRSTQVNDLLWVKNILHLYLGELSQVEFIESLKQGDLPPKVLNERLCEAYFYLGKLNLLQGNNNDAALFFKLALSTNVYDYVEHRYAQLELDLLSNTQTARY